MYIPVLKNGSVEFNVLKQLYEIPIPKQIIPMVEVIQEKVKTNLDKNFVDELSSIFRKHSEHSFLVDLVKTNVPHSTTPAVRDLLTKVNRKRDFYIHMLQRFHNIKNAIPVISYNHNSYNIKTIIQDENILRRTFQILAFRITSQTFSSVFTDIKNLLRANDLFILDIGSDNHFNPAFKKIYINIKTLKDQVRFKSIILNSTKEKEVTKIGDGEPIFSIDNSLKDAYKTHYFDGFGDYACVTNQLPSIGGTISPAGIYYSRSHNYFVGFRRNKDLSEFEVHIAPAIKASEYWKEYSEAHHKTCPGCKVINRIANGEEIGKSQAKWKEITMGHYIYTLSEDKDI